jgi:hypothetical protein
MNGSFSKNKEHIDQHHSLIKAGTQPAFSILIATEIKFSGSNHPSNSPQNGN